MTSVQLWLFLALMLLFIAGGSALHARRWPGTNFARRIRWSAPAQLLAAAVFIGVALFLQHEDDTQAAWSAREGFPYHPWEAPSWQVLQVALLVGGAALYFVAQLVLYLRHRRRALDPTARSLPTDG